jgi:UDP-N-acetylglucosamine acyltransferase
LPVNFIHPRARIHRTVVIGPFTIIEADVEIGAQTVIGGHVTIRGGSRIGKGNTISPGVQIGTDPQDYHFQGERSYCFIGDRNAIREYATISRATGKNKETRIGNDNCIMTYVHVAHNDRVGNHTVLASGTQLGGYVEVDDHAVVGGLSGVHQHCRIGEYAMLGAKSYLNKDLAPFLLARGNRARVYGVNARGLIINGFTWTDIERVKAIYGFIRDHPMNRDRSRKELKRKYKGRLRDEIIDFLDGSRRGILVPGEKSP